MHVHHDKPECLVLVLAKAFFPHRRPLLGPRLDGVLLREVEHIPFWQQGAAELSLARNANIWGGRVFYVLFLQCPNAENTACSYNARI